MAVLSGNRNFEGRIHPGLRANFLASPPLVVAYALAGSVLVNLEHESLGTGADGKPVYLRELWPDGGEIRRIIDAVVTPSLHRERYATMLDGTPEWRALKGKPRHHLRLVAGQHVHPAAAVLRGHGRTTGRARRYPRRARARRCSATCSPPTTSRRSA